MFNALISVQQLAELQNPAPVILDCRSDSALQIAQQADVKTTSPIVAPVILDCRFDLMNTSAGEQAYAAGHIPGALYAHLDRDLSGPITPNSGRHPLPAIETLAKTFGQFGIDRTTAVVVYDANNGMMASRAWWLLRWLGHDNVAVLNGGFQAWQQAGLPISTQSGTALEKTFIPKPRMNMLATASTVADLVNRDDWRVLDARAAERFKGQVEPIDPVAGHIPGAHNFPFAGNLDNNAQMLAPNELRARFARALENIPGERTVAMCGSGVTACHLLLAMEHAGIHGGKLYAGSWSEWIRDPKRPVAKEPVAEE